MYPSGQLSKNQVPNEIQLEMVQRAISQYAENNNGLLPIRTKDMDTPIFQKYLIEFTKLKEQGLLDSTPGTAFENGGVYQYVIITPEDNPTVKVIDLRLAEQIRSLQTSINLYRSEHSYPPFGEEVEDGMYKINYEKIGLDHDPYVVSPYSGINLPIVMDTNGQVQIDYRSDLYDALQTYEHNYEKGDDIRYLLTDHYPFAPAYSLPYTVIDGEPHFLIDDTAVR